MALIWTEQFGKNVRFWVDKLSISIWFDISAGVELIKGHFFICFLKLITHFLALLRKLMVTVFKSDWNCINPSSCLLGKKTWVANGPTADVFTVFANVRHRGEDGVQSNQLTAFIVDRSVSTL